MIKYRLILFIFIIFSTEIFAQNYEERKYEKPVILSMLLLGTSFMLDSSVKNFVQKNRSESLDDLFSFFNQFGDKYIIAVPVTGYVVGHYYGNKELKESSLLGLTSSLLTVTVIFSSKALISRKRPDYSDNDSFPSGHTGYSFSIFGSYSEYYNRYYYIFYSIPIMVGLSRIYKNKHYLSDTVAGGIIGLGSVYVVKNLIGKYLFDNSTLNVSLSYNSFSFTLKRYF